MAQKRCKPVPSHAEPGDGARWHCAGDEWYLIRATPAEPAHTARAVLPIVFQRADRAIGRRAIDLRAPYARSGELLGWFRTPARATHVQIRFPTETGAPTFDALALHRVAERDTKCHPLACPPRWDTYRTPFPIRRIVLPASLAPLTRVLAGADTQVLTTPSSKARLLHVVHEAAWVLDPAWVPALGLTLADLERLASCSWALVDLETMATLVRRGGVADVQLVAYASPHGMMSARVEYADVPTRGFALQDVAPYSVFDARGRFAQRALRHSRGWRDYAGEVGFATLLSTETPWAHRHGDVLSAMRPVGRGELIATDLPWLCAGGHGAPLAPRIAEHLLRMHVALPLADHVQFWNRWDELDVITRDIGDLAGRCPPLQTARWASPDARMVHLGITLPPLRNNESPRQHWLVQTGRIDPLADHDGLPPEPMMIFMKWLAREARERTPWALRHLSDKRVTWQFDTCAGLKYAANFDAAPRCTEERIRAARIRLDGRPTGRQSAPGIEAIVLAGDDGVEGDGAFAFQEALMRRLTKWLSSAAVTMGM